MNWKRLLGAGVAIGILLMLVQHTFNIDHKIFQTALLIVSILIFIVVLIYHTTSTSNFRKRVQNQLAMIQNGKPEDALQDMQEMLPALENKKNKHEAALCKLNMIAAHRELKQYEEALSILENLSKDEFDGVEQVVYLLNLGTCYYYVDQDEKGLKIYEDNKALFTDYDQHKRYGGSIAALLMLSKITQGKCDQAEKLLNSARPVWTDHRSQVDYDLVERKLAAAKAAPAQLPENPSEATAAESEA